MLYVIQNMTDIGTKTKQIDFKKLLKGFGRLYDGL